jgi:putative DNA primase/helicase
MMPRPDTRALGALTPEQTAQLATARARTSLTFWERSFLDDLAGRTRPLTAKQAEALTRCARNGLNFAAVNRAALPRLPELVARWLPGGKLIRSEWTCATLRGGVGNSCRVNLRTGRWADFATGEKGGDPVSLAAAVAGLPQKEAARNLAAMLGMGSAAHD